MVSAAESTHASELYRTPQPLAEDLDPSFTAAALREYESRKNPSGLFRSAWNFAEFGLNAKTLERHVRMEYFYVAQYLTPMIVDHPGASQDTKLNALTLATYLPALIKRSDETLLNHEDCSAIYNSLGYAMRYLRPLEVEEPPQWKMVEIGMLALSARTRQPHLLMYPTSPREENSDIPFYNHDSYYVSDQMKVPVQQKVQATDDVYDERIVNLIIEPLINKALKYSDMSTEVDLSEKVNYLLSLIITETTGLGLSRQERRFLNFMTESLAAHYQQAKSGLALGQAA